MLYPVIEHSFFQYFDVPNQENATEWNTSSYTPKTKDLDLKLTYIGYYDNDIDILLIATILFLKTYF